MRCWTRPLRALARLAVRRAAALTPVLLVGAPLRFEGKLFNCAVVIYRGRVLGIVPKTYLPNYREFYEKRQFTSGRDASSREVRFLGQRVPFGNDLIFSATTLPGFALHAEICEDVWTPIPPSTYAALAGATVLANLSASNITIGKADYRRTLCAGAVGPLRRGLSLLRRRTRRIDHRPGLGRPRPDLREQRAAGRGASASPPTSR